MTIAGSGAASASMTSMCVPTGASNSSTIASIRPRRAAMRRGVKALLTSLRTRVWSGGSMTSIERIVCAPC